MSILVQLACAILLTTATPAKPAKAPAPPPPPVVTEPEYVGIPYRLEPKTHELQQLERQTYALHTKVKGLGFGGARYSYDVPGTKSPVRFAAGESMKFVIKLASKDSDPSATIKLVPLAAAAAGKKQAKEGSAGTRQMIFLDQKGAFAQATVDPMLGAMPILVKQYGEASLEFKSETELQPGEYAVLMPATMTAFCFGIDAK